MIWNITRRLTNPKFVQCFKYSRHIHKYKKKVSFQLNNFFPLRGTCTRTRTHTHISISFFLNHLLPYGLKLRAADPTKHCSLWLWYFIYEYQYSNTCHCISCDKLVGFKSLAKNILVMKHVSNILQKSYSWASIC